MRIVTKLSLWLCAGTLAVITVDAAMRVHREETAFEDDMRQDHQIMGGQLVTSVEQVWRLEGEAAALEILREQPPAGEGAAVFWFPAGEAEDLPPDSLSTRFPLVVDGVERGRVVVSEPLEPLRRYVRQTIVNTAEQALALFAVLGGIGYLLGTIFVGRPVNRIIEKARRIGAGDLTGPLPIDGNDELGIVSRELNQMCERLARAQEQIRHADRLATVGKLASGVAHELGTPLNVVTLRARMSLEEECVNSDCAHVIIEQSERMTAIIRQLLDFARRSTPDKSVQDLRPIAERTMRLLANLAGKKQVTLELEPGEATPVAVDAGQIQQVLMNLTMNAIHAMSRPGTVRLSLGPARAAGPSGGAPREWVRLSVSDEGEGIPEEALPHLFEPFFTTKPIGEGTGLGLAVSYGIVQEHGGYIDVDTRPGQGTRMSVMLPATEGTWAAAS